MTDALPLEDALASLEAYAAGDKRVAGRLACRAMLDRLRTVETSARDASSRAVAAISQRDTARNLAESASAELYATRARLDRSDTRAGLSAQMLIETRVHRDELKAENVELRAELDLADRKAVDSEAATMFAVPVELVFALLVLAAVLGGMAAKALHLPH